MYEIELKAHVYDKTAVSEKLNSFAAYKGKVSKYDSYWKQSPLFSLLRDDGEEDKGTVIRIRIEKTDCEKNPTRTLVTGKHKSRVGSPDTAGSRSVLEVNEEREFTVSDAAAFEHLIINAGFSPVFTKYKECIQWVHDDVLIELCRVGDLGDFLELEIMREIPGDIKEARRKLERLLEKCGVPLEQIEPMYYSELSAAKKKKGAC